VTFLPYVASFSSCSFLIASLVFSNVYSLLRSKTPKGHALVTDCKLIVIQFQVDSVSALLMTRVKLKTLLHSYKMWLMDISDNHRKPLFELLYTTAEETRLYFYTPGVISGCMLHLPFLLLTLSWLIVV
jgi:hypothetical protein